MLELLNNDYQTEERFLRQVYAAYRREINKPFITSNAQYPLGAVATRSNLLKIYESQISRDAEGTLDGLIENAEEYTKIINPQLSEISESVKCAFEDLTRIQGAPSYILILYLLKEKQLLGLTDENLSYITNLLVKFFVRRNLTDTPPTRDLARIFTNIVEGIKDKKIKGDVLVDYIREEICATASSDDVFKAELSGPVYVTNPEATRFILAKLAEPSITKEMAGL